MWVSSRHISPVAGFAFFFAPLDLPQAAAAEFMVAQAERMSVGADLERHLMQTDKLGRNSGPGACMTNRERFFAILAGQPVDRTPYFPDLSTWYVPRRTPAGQPQKYGPGELVPDGDIAFHRAEGELALPVRFRDWTYLDFYRRFDWGLPVHLYDWYGVEYDGAEETTVVEGRRRTRRWHCPPGSADAERAAGTARRAN